MSSLDQKRAFNKLKHELEPWRNLIIQVDSILSWEKNYYPAIVCSSVTAFFLILWLFDFSTITMLALFALIVVIIDKVYPKIFGLFYSADNWSGVDEEHFEDVCSQLCNIRIAYNSWYEYIFTSKERKSSVFVVIISCALLVLAWLGSVMNNYLLMYFIALTLALYPGVHKRCLIGVVKEQLGSVVNDKIKLLREKKGD